MYRRCRVSETGTPKSPDPDAAEVIAATDAAEVTAATAPVVKAQRRMRIQEFALPVVVVALCIAGQIIDSDFFTTGNLQTILVQASVVGVIAVGMTFVIATG